MQKGHEFVSFNAYEVVEEENNSHTYNPRWWANSEKIVHSQDVLIPHCLVERLDII